MTKRLLKLIFAFTLVLSMLLLFVAMPSAKANTSQPPPPCIFYGNVSVGGQPAQDGLNVTAVIGGTILSWTTETKNGTYGWPVMGSNYLEIPTANASAPEKDGGVTGDTVVFYVEGVQNVQTAYFDSGTAVRFDLSVTEIPLRSFLTASLDCPVLHAGYEVNVSGVLAFTNGTGISNANLSLAYMNESGTTWASIGYLNTSSDGSYYTEWTPPNATGDYLIKVSWEGNETVEGAEADVSIATTASNGPYVFPVVSNSVVYDLAYNSTGRVLSFTVAGSSGTMGYANVTIARDLIGEITGVKVYLDQSIIHYTATPTNASWLLHFTYQHSTHEVVVDLASPPVDEFSYGMAIIGMILISAATISVVVGRRKLRVPKEVAYTP